MESQNKSLKKRVRNQEQKDKDREYHNKKNQKLKNNIKKWSKLKEDHMELQKKYNDLLNFKEQSTNEINLLQKLVQELKEENKRLIDKKFNLKVKLSELEKEIKKENLSQKIMDNTCDLISRLSYNNPYRRPLFSFLLNGLSFSEAEKVYSISKRTFNRVMKEDGNTIINQKYAIGTKKERVSKQRKDEVQNILDDILPVQSGRNYRYQEITNKALYEKYLSLVKSGSPLSKTYFIYTILAQYNVHHSKKMKFCVYCEQIQNGINNSDLDKHLELVSIQRRSYVTDKI